MDAMKQDKADELIARALKRFAEVEAEESEIRAAALDDLQFRIGEQWPEDIKHERELEGQACLTINRVPAFVRQVVNEMRQMRPAIKVRGVDSKSDPKTAEVINGMIRAIEADSTADSAYDWAGEYAATCGFGYWRVTTEYENEQSFDQCIRICRVRNPFAVYLDHNAEEQDGSDARWGFVVEDYTKEEFEAKWPDATTTASWRSTDGASEWVSKNSVRVAEYWELEEESATLYQLFDGSTTTELPPDTSPETLIPTPTGLVPLVVNSRETTTRKIMQYILTAAEVLETHEWVGKYIPIVRVLGEELIVDGEREIRGMIRDMKDPQRMYNYARSQYVDRVSLAPKMPYIGAKGAFDDPNWNRINTANLPYVEYKPVPGEPGPRREMGPDASPGLIAEMQQTAEELKAVTGIYNPGLGDRSNEVSGVAIDSRKLESDVGNFHYLDNLAKAIRYTGKILVDLIPKIYTGPRMVRILAIDGEEEQVGLNQQYMDQKTGKMRAHMLDTGRYDVSVDTGPSYTTQRQESVQNMLEIIRTVPASAPLIGDILAKNMDWAGADELAKRLKLLLPPEIAANENPAIGQMQKQMQQREQQALEMIAALQHQIAQLQLEVQNKNNELQAKIATDAAKLAEDRRQADLDHIEGMTKLELEAARNLNQAGAAY